MAYQVLPDRRVQQDPPGLREYRELTARLDQLDLRVLRLRLLGLRVLQARLEAPELRGLRGRLGQPDPLAQPDLRALPMLA